MPVPQEIVNTIRSIENTILQVSPIYVFGDTHAEKRMLMAVIRRAMDDIKYSLDQGATTEQKGWGRDALKWIFIEHLENAPNLHRGASKKRLREIQITSFDSVCQWLNIDPTFLRREIGKRYELDFMKPFI